MTKKMKRVLLSAFVCAGTAILGGAALQFDKAAVKAETSPKLNICGYTLSLKDNIHIKYAVSTENTATATDFGMLVWTEPQTEYVYGTQATVLEQTSTTEQNGVEYPVFEYAELAARQMTDVVYSRAYAVIDGEYYYSEVKKYSILEYAYNKLGLTEATATSDQALVDLLNGMLEYGGLAQTYFGYKTDELASDPFAYVRVANATFADGFDYGIFRTGKEVSVTPNDGYVLSENAPNAFKADESGNVTLTVPQEKEIYETAFEIPEVYSEGLAYTLNSNGVSYSVTGIGTCTDTDVVIPAKYEGLPVTSIGASAFKNCSSLTSVTIGNSVTSIGIYAFRGCRSLTSITIPDSVTSIGDYAFAYCYSLTSITIPDSVMSIGNYAFYRCSSLTSITIPDSVTSIGDSAFNWCSNLTSITVDENNFSYQSINGNLYTKDGLKLIQYAIGKTATEFTIPDSVISIGDWAFYNCYSLASVTIPDSVISIGDWAFYNCSGLTSITISDSVTSIGISAFHSCSGLTSITIPDSVTSIGGSAFHSCSGLTSITVDENNFSYQSIDGNLYTKDGLKLIQYAIGKTATEFTIPNSVTSISPAFTYCGSLTSITIPDSVTSIEDSAFYDCRNLTSVYYTGTEKAWTNITVDTYGNEPLTNATRYYYSESEPALNADGTAYDGNYWHYNENGEITVWKYVEATFTVVVGSNTVTVPADGTATLQFTASATSQYKITCSSGTLTDENGATVSIISCTKGEVYTVILTATAGSTVKVTIRTYDPDEENWTPNY